MCRRSYLCKRCLRFITIYLWKKTKCVREVTSGPAAAFCHIKKVCDRAHHLLSPPQAIMHYYPEVKKAIGASEKMFEYLDRKPEVPPEGTLAPESLRGHIQFRNVTFSYAGKTDKDTVVLKVSVSHHVFSRTFVCQHSCDFIVLRKKRLDSNQTPPHSSPPYQNVSLEIKQGQVTAIVGPNRSGKSTCVKLLERFYQPQAGEILLDGEPLHRYKDQFLHDKVGGSVCQTFPTVCIRRFIRKLTVSS